MLAVPLLCMAVDDFRPVCNSQNQGQMWPEAANHDPKLMASLIRCGELLICVRGILALSLGSSECPARPVGTTGKIAGLRTAGL